MALGDVIYRGSSVWKRLVGNTTTTAKYLKQTGTGSASTAPAWAQVSVNDIAWSEYDAGTSGTSKTIDWTNAPAQQLSLTGSVTLTLTNPQAGATYDLVLTQDATGSRTVTWPAAVKWAGGTPPTLSTVAARVDRVTLKFTGTTYHGTALINLS